MGAKSIQEYSSWNYERKLNMTEQILTDKELQSKQNKLKYTYTKMQEYHRFFAWLNHEFDVMDIKCKISPAQVSLCLRDFYCEAKEEFENLEKQKEGNSNGS